MIEKSPESSPTIKPRQGGGFSQPPSPTGPSSGPPLKGKDEKMPATENGHQNHYSGSASSQIRTPRATEADRWRFLNGLRVLVPRFYVSDGFPVLSVGLGTKSPMLEPTGRRQKQPEATWTARPEPRDPRTTRCSKFTTPRNRSRTSGPLRSTRVQILEGRPLRRRVTPETRAGTLQDPHWVQVHTIPSR